MAIIKLTDLLGEPTYFNKNHIASFYRAKDGDLAFTVIWIVGIKYNCNVKETPEEILALIKEAELPKFTFYNNNVDFSKQKHNSRVQEIIDQAHATKILMQEEDPTYGR